MGVENIPKVPSVAPFCPSADVVAQQSVNVTTLKPFSQAVRIVDSTQQLVRKPHKATVSIPFVASSCSKSVPGNASKPFLFFTMRSPSTGFMASQNSEFHVPSVKSLSFAQPARMPKFLFGLSDPSSLNMIGACITLAPLSRAVLHTSAAFLSMSVWAITSLTAGYNLPPSVVNSFWNSMHKTAVVAGSIWQPPMAWSGAKTRASGDMTSTSTDPSSALPLLHREPKKAPITSSQPRKILCTKSLAAAVPISSKQLA
mmetsp:Transcript_118501/g.209439  ORF Transcript_118501/g.209439 Transcript_118501/m.209439 type:complete len:257 (-) Transcript_118501:7-777(-)